MPTITINLLDSAGLPAMTKVLSFKAFDGSVLSATAGTDSFSVTLDPQTYRVLIDGVDSGVDYTPRFDSAPATMPAHLGGGYYLMAHPRSISIDKRVTQPGSHTHIIGDVTGLQSALDGKSPTGHTHSSLVPENINEINVNTSMAGSTLWWGYRGATNAITKHAFSQGRANGALARLDIADATEPTNAVTKSQLDTKVDKVTGRQLMPDPNGDSRYVLNGAGNWFQALGSDGLLRADLMPPLAISETFTCSTQSAMLALTAQKGDICVRTDLGGTYILAAEPATTLANWTQILTPADGVQSINSKSGASITLDHGDLFNLNADSTKLHVTQTEKDTWSGKQSALSSPFEIKTRSSAAGIYPSNSELKRPGINGVYAVDVAGFGTGLCASFSPGDGSAHTLQIYSWFQDQLYFRRLVDGSTADRPWIKIWDSNSFDPSTKEPSISTSTTAKYYRGDKTWQTLDKTAVGLGNVDNTTDANKPISTATQAALDTKAPSTHTHSTVMHTGGVDTSYSTGTSRSLSTNRTVMPASGESRYYSVYYNGYPAPFGNTTQTFQNGFCTEIFVGASGGTASGQTAVSGMWFRNLADWGSTWSNWAQVWHSDNFDPSTKANTSHAHSSLVPENTNEININTSMAGSTLYWGYRGATNAITKHVFGQGKANAALARIDIAAATETTNAVTKGQADAAYVAKGGAGLTTNFTVSTSTVVYAAQSSVTAQVSEKNGLRYLRITGTPDSNGNLVVGPTDSYQQVGLMTITNWSTLWGAAVTGILSVVGPYGSATISGLAGKYPRAAIAISVSATGLVTLHANGSDGHRLIPNTEYQAIIPLL